MGKGHGSLGRTARIGAFVAGLMLALALPSIALAANVATFSSVAPAPGSSTASVRPIISVTVYDRYGVSGTRSYRALYLDGVYHDTAMTRVSGTTRLVLRYNTTSDLSQGIHTVRVTVKDLKGHTSTYSWSFTVTTADSIPPVTTEIGTFPVYDTGTYTSIQLNATDAGSGVAHTYYILDGGPTITGNFVFGHFLPGAHTLEYWSVDVAGNVETHKFLSGTVSVLHAVLAAYSDVTCFQTGCHVGHDDTTTTLSVTAIHAAVPGRTDNGCGICHSGTGIPTADCATVGCHSASDAATHQYIFGPHAGIHTTSFAITSTLTPTPCTNSGCHATTLVSSYTHTSCGVCHGSADTRIDNIISNALATETNVTCEACHLNSLTPTYAAIHAPGNASHAVSGACFSSDCHQSDVSSIHASGVDKDGNPAPGCVACHPNTVTTTTRNGGVPSTNCDLCHSNISSLHNFTHTAVASTTDSACVACHGADLPTAHNGVFTGQADLGCFCHFTGYLAGEMAPLVKADYANCTDCHKNAHAAHDFSVTPTGTITATMPIVSGHNTTTYGTVGAYSKFDGSQGVLLKDSTGATVTTTWGLPTVNVFWSQDPSRTVDAPAGANTTVGWTSVITCEDCHTGLSAAGPHGASQNWGIDPNYPYPYADAVNSHNFMSGIAARTTTDVANPGLSSTQAYPGVGTPTNWTGVAAAEMSHGLVDGGQSGTSYAVICSKCHKLFDYNSASQGVTSVSYGPTWLVTTGISNDSNTAHGSHHFDLNNGAADCVNCHVAIPHGWVRPRLLVNGFTGTYVTNNGTTQTVNSIADPAPFWGGRGMISVTGAHIGMGPLSASDSHALTVAGGASWTEADCIACTGSSTSTVNPSGLKHTGGLTDVGKLQ